MSLAKQTKAQLIDLIEEMEEDKYSVLQAYLGLPYTTDDEWCEYIQNLTEDDDYELLASGSDGGSSSTCPPPREASPIVTRLEGRAKELEKRVLECEEEIRKLKSCNSTVH